MTDVMPKDAISNMVTAIAVFSAPYERLINEVLAEPI